MWLSRKQRVRARRGTAGALAGGLLLLGACGRGEPSAPPTIAVTPLGVWEAGGRANTMPALPVEHAGKRAWAMQQVPTPAGVHRIYDVAPGGEFDVVYEAPDGSSFVLHANQPNMRQVGEHSVAIHEPLFEANGSLAVDDAGRLFAAWEEGSSDWGLGGALREERRIVMAASEDGATWHRVSLPADEVLAAPRAGDERFGGIPTAPEGRCVEAPRLVVDGTGVPWLVYRWLTRWMPADHARQADGAGGANRRAAWRLRAMALTDAGWTAPVDLARSDGPADGGLEAEALTASGAGGIGLRWFTDQRLERLPKALAWEEALPGAGGWLAAELRLEAEADPPADLTALGPELVPDRAGRTRFDGSRAGLASRPSLLFGDLHRHTDASRCKIEEDGTLLDQLRYAVEVGGLDVLCITNHFQHATPASWARELAFADSFDGLALDDHQRESPSSAIPGPVVSRRLVMLPGYERALPLGHWTMVADPAGPDPASLTDAPFGPFRPRFLWDEHEPGTWLAMPHQIADRTAPLDWRTDSELAPVEGSAFEPLAELYQSRRGSYEVAGGWLEDLGVSEDGPRLVDYLDSGRRFGFGASSDHTTTSRAYTGIHLESFQEPSREAVLAALRARRTFAATVRMYLAPRLDGLPMGSVVPAGDGKTLAVHVDLKGIERAFTTTDSEPEELVLRRGSPPDRLAAVELVKNGEVVHRWAGAELDEDGRRRGLLTLRVGRSVQDQVVRFEVFDGDEDADASLGTALAFRTEDDDVLTGDAGAVRLEAALDTRDEDGFTVPIAWEPEAAVTAIFAHPKEKTIRTHSLAGLAHDGSTGVFRVRGGRAELRLDPPALGGTKLTDEVELGPLVPGDWLYLRLRTVRGEAAWCSPWFIE